jgi:hypothetical protein
LANKASILNDGNSKKVGFVLQGNGTEKMRVGRFDCSDEVVLDLYAGIGTPAGQTHECAKKASVFIIPPCLRRGTACRVFSGQSDVI